MGSVDKRNEPRDVCSVPEGPKSWVFVDSSNQKDVFDGSVLTCHVLIVLHPDIKIAWRRDDYILLSNSHISEDSEDEE